MKNDKGVIFLLVLFMGISIKAHASRGCRNQYFTAVQRASVSASNAEGNTHTGTMPFPVIGLVFTSTANVQNAKAKGIDKALSLLDEAYTGDGIVLREFARDTGLTVELVADILVKSDQALMLCEDRVYTYNGLVKLVKARK